MKKILAILMTIILTGVYFPACAAPKYRIDRVQEKDINVYQNYGENVVVQAGAVVPFVFAQDVTSKTLNANDRIAIKVERDIYADNILAFKAGGEGYVYAGTVKRARRIGKQGQIYFTDGYVKDKRGIERHIIFNDKYKGKKCKWANIIGSAMIWNPIGWIVIQKRGTDAFIPQGTRATAILSEDFKLK